MVRFRFLGPERWEGGSLTSPDGPDRLPVRGRERSREGALEQPAQGNTARGVLPPALSVVVPAYDEESRIVRSLRRILIYLENIDWFGGINAIIDSDLPDVELAAMRAEPEGALTLVGFVTDSEARARLLNDLSTISAKVEFQGIQWRPESDPPEFSALFQVQR